MFFEKPFNGNNKPNGYCDEPNDIAYDSCHTWVINNPSLPKTPSGFKRELITLKWMLFISLLHGRNFDPSQ